MEITLQRFRVFTVNILLHGGKCIPIVMPEGADAFIKAFHAVGIILHDGGLCLLEAEFMVLFQDTVHIIENQQGGQGENGDDQSVQGENLRGITYGFPVDEIDGHQGKSCVKLRQKETQEFFRTGGEDGEPGQDEKPAEEAQGDAGGENLHKGICKLIVLMQVRYGYAHDTKRYGKNVVD